VSRTRGECVAARISLRRTGRISIRGGAPPRASAFGASSSKNEAAIRNFRTKRVFTSGMPVRLSEFLIIGPAPVVLLNTLPV
jgi:hypothetical protein